VTYALAVVQATGHRLVARNAARHVLLVTRDVEHDSVTTGTGLFDGDEAWRTLPFVTRVSVGRMTTWATLRAWMGTDERSSSARDGRFLDGFTARAHDVVEDCLQAAIAPALVTSLLTQMLSTIQSLVASHAADVEAFRIGGIVVRWTTASRTLVLSARLHATTNTLTDEGRRNDLLVWEDIATFHRLGGGMTATGDLNLDLARTARTRMAHIGTAMTTFADFVANRLTRGDIVHARGSGHTIAHVEDGMGTTSTHLHKRRLKLTGLARSKMTHLFATMVSTVEKVITGGMTREEARFSGRGIFMFILRTTSARSSRLTAIAFLIDLLGARRASIGVASKEAFVARTVE